MTLLNKSNSGAADRSYSSNSTTSPTLLSQFLLQGGGPGRCQQLVLEAARFPALLLLHDDHDFGTTKGDLSAQDRAKPGALGDRLVQILFLDGGCLVGSQHPCKRTNSEYSLAQHQAGDESLRSSKGKILQPPNPESCSTGQPGACFRGGSSPEYTFEYNGASAAAEVFFLRDGVFSLWVAGDFSEWEGLGDCKRGSEGNEPVV